MALRRIPALSSILAALMKMRHKMWHDARKNAAKGEGGFGAMCSWNSQCPRPRRAFFLLREVAALMRREDAQRNLREGSLQGPWLGMSYGRHSTGH
jgi:hypothetical protein